MSAHAPIDLRSDTVPEADCPGMRRERWPGPRSVTTSTGEGPTILALERKTAESARQGRRPCSSLEDDRQLRCRRRHPPRPRAASRSCGATAHVLRPGRAACARLVGRPASGRSSRSNGMVTATLRRRQGVRPDDGHYVRTRLVSLENTHNRAGGRVHPLDDVAAIAQWARSNGLAMHLDGARLIRTPWSASGVPATDWGKRFDTAVSICFLLEGASAPPSARRAAGPRDLIKKAHRLRKVFGGGMRQAGILAAAAIHALDQHVARLADDHANARLTRRSRRSDRRPLHARRIRPRSRLKPRLDQRRPGVPGTTTGRGRPC